VVCPARIERATYGLEGRCSIQLSYGQNKKKRMDANLPLPTEAVRQGAALCRVYDSVSMLRM
jgi:hypothetical protein